MNITLSDRETLLPAHFDAKPCPFCGAPASIQPWHGGGPMKRLVGCANNDCDIATSVTGSTPRKALAAWNRRAAAEKDNE